MMKLLLSAFLGLVGARAATIVVNGVSGNHIVTMENVDPAQMTVHDLRERVVSAKGGPAAGPFLTAHLSLSLGTNGRAANVAELGAEHTHSGPDTSSEEHTCSEEQHQRGPGVCEREVLDGVQQFRAEDPGRREDASNVAGHSPANDEPVYATTLLADGQRALVVEDISAFIQDLNRQDANE
eukprot:g2195.t1